MTSDANSFEQCFQFTAMKWEGGEKYTNDPVDPGGETKFGISKRAFPNEDIKNMTIDRARVLYRTGYWESCGCPSKSPPLAAALFDSAVNLGPARAIKFLSESQDNYIWLIEERKDYYYELIAQKPQFKKYQNGWFNRLNDLRKFCDILAQQTA